MNQKYLIASAVAAMLAQAGVVSIRHVSGEIVPGSAPAAPKGMQPTPCQLQQAVQTAAGTTIAISANTPPTFDSTGYTSSNMVWQNIGEITDAGTHGRKYTEVTHKPIATRGIRKYKGSFDEGTKTIQMALDSDDAGQVIAKAASLSDNDYSFRVQYPNGDADYFQAKVMTFEKQASNVDSIVSASMQLSLTSSSGGVGIVEVLAP